MIRRGKIEAWLTNHPWNDAYELRIVHDAGAALYAATELVDGCFKYEAIEEGTEVAPVLRLGAAEIDAILEALKQEAKPVDATVDALRDTREVRDRLFALVERVVK